MKVEREIKFYFPISRLDYLKSMLSDFKYIYTKHELTLNYDNPNQLFSFYDKNIDGRLRLRIMRQLDNKNIGKITGLFSWKQRIPEHSLSQIRHEKEIECNISGDEVNNLKSILSDVLKCPLISSCERERSHYYTDDLDITLDMFPFGIMLEIEFKENSDESKDVFKLIEVLKKMKLNFDDASFFSCDDMYKHLCREQNKKIKSHILFEDEDMPLL